MFGRLITPLKARFDLSPRPEAAFQSKDDIDTMSAENFARDVLMQLMRNLVDSLKEAESLQSKIDVMGEMHRVMIEDSCTKDVFRELDGYLLVVNVLSILHPYLEMEGSGTTLTEDGERLAFMLLAESLKGHIANQSYFEKHVGYESIAQALCALIKDPRTVDQTFGFLLSVALDNFALSSLFVMLRLSGSTDCTEHLALLKTVTNIHFYMLLIVLLRELPVEDEFLPSAAFALTDTLISINHRNRVLFSNTSLFKEIFELFIHASSKSRAILQKLSKKLLDIGAPDSNVRLLFQRVVKDEGSLDSDVLDIVRSGMKAKWPLHFSMEGSAAFQINDENVRGLPATGFTFMLWLWVEQFPTSSRAIFKIWNDIKVLFQLSLRLDGIFELFSSGNDEMAVLEHAKLAKGRWTHVALVHHPHRGTSPSIRIFLDGVLRDKRTWAYPRSENVQTVHYTIGDSSLPLSNMSWCLASAYLITLPLSDDLPFLIQHLGPRYVAHFQTKHLVRFLTYEAATSLNIHLSNDAVSGTGKYHKSLPSPPRLPLISAIKDGMGIGEESFYFSLSTNGLVTKINPETGFDDIYVQSGAAGSKSTSRTKIEIHGTVTPVKNECLDIALWRIGGPSVALRIVELASSPHELSRALGIFVDGARTSWQMSEDMENIHAYDILAHILRSKSQLINITAFETFFEFLGLDFRTPDQSVVANTLAYRAVALDFEIWAHARPEIQVIHFDHFSTLLKTSKYRNYNAKQRLAKLNIIRKLLFVVQMDYYAKDMMERLIATFKVIVQSCFSTNETIKPIVSYLGASLHEDKGNPSSPHSIMSHTDKSSRREKAELILGALVSVLRSSTHLARFSAALPLSRICLLLLGERPTAYTAVQVLTIIGLALKSSASFSRKFELVSGWTALKMTLPGAWNSDVQRTAFDILFGRIGENEKHQGPDQDVSVVSCPYIAPAIIAALDRGLTMIAQDELDEETLITEGVVESLLEELMGLQSTSPAFRQVFKSPQVTSLLISSYAALVSNGNALQVNIRNYIRVLEKMNHFVLTLTLDKVVSSAQKQELLDIFQKAERVLNDHSQNNGNETASGRSSNKVSIQGTRANTIGEKAYQRTVMKNREWRESIIASERKRFRRMLIDLREEHRHIEQSTEWRNALHDDRGFWPVDRNIHTWVLDETEGPCRVRKKLERRFDVVSTSVDRDPTRTITEPDAEVQSFIQVEAPPWAESYELNTAVDDNWLDEFAEDKLRRIRHELERGDVVEAVCTVTRIVGVDSSPGLLILGRTHIYMLDGLIENEDGEVIDAQDAPRNLFSVPGSLLELDGKQRSRKWTYNQIASFSKKTCLFRDVALEVYFKDSCSLLIVFPSKKLRLEISDKLTSSMNTTSLAQSRSPLLHRTPLIGKMSAKVLSNFRDELSTAQRKWQAREISNFTYLSILNQTSGRTPGDATQYPVFPWVLADYSSENLDLSSASTFRNLSYPMGALTDVRREAARQRYQNLQSIGEGPFHYGTHFSSSMIICHFLIRLEPYTHMYKTLQGGDWDLPDRLFSDISRAYHSASQDLRGDVRELIPEFFTCPEFLLNLSNLDFGVQQLTGEKIHDVKLPPWAKKDPLLFIIEHRRALESDYVSENLPNWIDLIWGYKQRDAESLNVFHPLSYEGSIDLDAINDELEREATVGIIHNFGQTPRKLFDSPHPPKLMHGPTTLPLGTQFGIEEDSHLLVQSSRPVSEIQSPVASLVVDTIAERVIPCRRRTLIVPQYPHEQLTWGFTDQSIKLKVDRKVTQTAESISCLCAIFVHSELFVTGSSDSMLRLWRLSRSDGITSMSQTHTLRAHSGPVLCITACKTWSIIVSGSEDGSAVIWDLNRAIYVRSIWHGDTIEHDSVNLVAVNDSTGYIASCSPKKLCLHTVNAIPIVEFDLSLCHPSDGVITSLAFHEREYSRYGVLATGTSVGTIVLRTWTTKDTPENSKAVWNFFTMRTLQCREGSDGRRSKISALQFVGESLYHGEEGGKVYVWDLPE